MRSLYEEKTLRLQTCSGLEALPDSVLKFLSSSSHGAMPQNPGWLSEVENRKDPLVISLFEGDKCVFGAVVHKSSLLGTKYFVGIISRGPVFDNIDTAIEGWSKFEAELRERSCVAIMIQPYWERLRAQQLENFLEKSGYRLSNWTTAHDETLVIDLSHSEEDILLNTIDSKRRNMIRKGRRMGIQVHKVTDSEQLHAFWQMHRTMCKKKGISGPKWENWKRIGAYSKTWPNDCTCMLQYLGGNLLGGAIFLRHGDRVVYTWGSSTMEKLPGTPKTELAIWEGIRWAKGIGVKQFDLGGIDTGAIERSAVWHVGQFKKKFSSQHVLLMRPAEKKIRPLIYYIHKSLQKVKRAICSFTRNYK